MTTLAASRHPARRAARSVATAVLATAVVAVAVLAPAPSPAAAAPAGDASVVAFVVRGVGNGHGRGLSQWGAYGRAVNGGQSWQQILDAYYGGTVAGTRSEPALSIRLTGWDGVGVLGVWSPLGSARWHGSATDYTSLYAQEVAANQFHVYAASTPACPSGSALPVPRVDLAKGASGDAVRQLQALLNYFGASLAVDGSFGNLTQAALIAFQTAHALAPDGIWQVDDWTAAEQLLAAQGTAAWTLLTTTGPIAGPVVFSTGADQSATAPASVLGVCEPDGTVTHYRGSVELRDVAGSNRVVNRLDVDNYLRGVVPKEVSASWGNAASGAGMHALRAQAVAARSYGLAQNRYAPWAKTCDTTSCQVYAGSATRSAPTAAGWALVEHPLTDQAIAETAGVVRLKDGAVVSTEFSASNGPRTAGNTFPAVDDPWDDVPGNPNHRWTRVIDADAVIARYGLANADAVATVPDPSVAYDGIWDHKIVSGATTLATAWDFRNAFDLPSPGFELIPVRRGLTAAGTMTMIGDSVGAGISGTDSAELPVLLEGVFAPATYDNRTSRRTQGGSVPDGVSAAAGVPIGTDLVVVELGYNDDPASMPARIDALMSALRARQVGLVAWVNLAERDAKYATTNAALQAAAGRWAELTVLDWRSHSAGASRWFSDAVHLTATGRAELAVFLRDRIIDLAGDGYQPPRPLAPGHVLRVPVVGQFGVPGSGVAGVALNVTAVNPAGPGWLRVWSCGSPEPDTSSVNYVSKGAVEPNAVVVPVDATGAVCIRTLAVTDLVVDVSGWFDTGVLPASGRLVDTRDAAGVVRPGQPLRVPVLGRVGVPATGVAGVALNVTAVETSAPGWLRVWPCGSPEPTTSSVNFTSAGAVEPNAVIVPVDATGEVCVATLVDTEVIVDMAAWFDRAIRPATGRLVDSRQFTDGEARSLQPGTPLRVAVAGNHGVPGVGAGGPVGVALNVTAVNPTGPGWLRVWPCGSPEPETSSVNYLRAGAVEPNAVVVPVDATGEVCISSLVPSEVVVDVSGWFDGALRSAVGRIVDTRIGLGPIPER